MFFTALDLFATAAFYVINLMPQAFSYRLRLSGNFIRTFNIVMLNCIVMQGAVAQSFGAGEVSRTAMRTLKGEKTNQGEERPFKANMLLPASAGEEGRKLGITLSGSNTGKCAVNGNCFSSLDYENFESCTFTMGAGAALDVVQRTARQIDARRLRRSRGGRRRGRGGRRARRAQARPTRR